jgi:hypothetical protein
MDGGPILMSSQSEINLKFSKKRLDDFSCGYLLIISHNKS